MQPDRIMIAGRFGSSERTYDYLCPFPVEIGQRVYVPTRKGGEAKVTVVEIKMASDSATVEALRIVEEEIQPEQTS